jgi:hypothetical protein
MTSPPTIDTPRQMLYPFSLQQQEQAYTDFNSTQ